MDSHHFGNLALHPKSGSASGSVLKNIGIRIRGKLDPEPDPHQFADDKPKCMEYELI
jgi:hypothetical protein